MAERAGTGGGGTSLRGLRERMVAAAHAMAEERRNQSGFSSASQSSNIKSSFKPVIDGSVLKSDTRQRLAKERREEKKRQQDANKETQLLEKERKSRIQYEKLMEEKQRKLKEQKEKDEQRRISAEEKRKQKLQEERERFKAVVYRTLERSNRVDHRQKRWSWEGSTTMNPETKNETTEKRSSSLNRRSNKLQSPMETEKVEEKPGARHQHTSLRENNLISRLLVPTKASIARSKSAASLSVPGKETPGNRYPVLQYVTTPLRGHSSDELKNTIVLRKSAMAVPPQEKVGALPKAKVEAPPKASTSMEVASNVNVGAIPKVSVEVDPEANMEAAPEVNEATPQASMEGSPEGSVEASAQAGAEALPDSVETSPEVSVDMSLEVSVDPSPEVSMDSSLEMSTDASPDGSMQVSSEASVEASTKAGMAASPKASVETLPEESVEASPEAFLEKPEMDKQANNPGTKKRPSSQIPCYKWPSSPASGWRPPSPISVNRQMQKNRPPSPSPVRSKQSQPSLCYKVIPVQRNLLAQNVLGTLGKKREAVSKTTSSSEAVSQKQTVCEEPSSKSTPGTMNAEEATKILAEKRRLAREQREKEERLQKETEERKVKEMAEKGVDTQGEEFSKLEDGQRRDEMKKGCTDPEDQKVLLQKGDTKIKADEEADKRKKEHERIMLQNLQERLERKKRIEEIMKRTRKTYSNTSQAAETFSDNTYEEDEADDEDESESDDDSFNDLHPSAFINGMDSSTKFKTHFKNMKKNTPKLVFLDATSGQVHRETKTFFNGDMKTFRPKSAKNPLTQAKGTRPSSKRMSSRATKTRKASETSNTVGPNKSVHPEAQEWICDKTVDIRDEAESLMSSIPPDSRKYHLKGSITFHQSPQMPLDDKKNKCVPLLLDM
ncbi:MAP7 domain-containing protein 3 isoform X6 [Panthera tigris]|uniref:MAP7 domain-containing protein 3 isoform X6 n=1 Tax=Panthera tigris TaxID=9694 RepID=UPI001C6F782A|nr:MAP7 domain-containing protein 3 isoform X6 [Panthera tigris]